MQRDGTLMANGHGEDTWLDVLQGWMPSLIAGFALITAWIAAGVAWWANDRRKTRKALRGLRADVDLLQQQLLGMEEMEDYPSGLTTERLHDVQRQAGKIRHNIGVAQKLLDRSQAERSETAEGAEGDLGGACLD